MIPQPSNVPPALELLLHLAISDQLDVEPELLAPLALIVLQQMPMHLAVATMLPLPSISPPMLVFLEDNVLTTLFILKLQENVFARLVMFLHALLLMEFALVFLPLLPHVQTSPVPLLTFAL